MTVETLELEAVLQSRPVKLKQKDGSKSYTLMELTGEEKEDYLDTMKDRFKYGPDGNVIDVKNFKGLHSALLKKCMIDDETSKLITEDELKKLPSSTTDALFKAASKLSALDKESIEEAKNDSEAKN